MNNFLGSNIRHLRKSKNLTQDQLADKLGVKRAMIGSYEEGRATPKIHALQTMSHYFNVSIDDMINMDLKTENLETVSSIIKNSEIDFGVALDGDADRVIFLDGNGLYIEPIRLLTFLAKEELKSNKSIKKPAKIVTPINSSGVIDHVLKPLGCEVIRTQVGDIKVAMEIQKSGAFLGGENAGTYIWPKFHFGPDSLVTIAKIIEILSFEDKSFTELISEIPIFPFIKKSYPLAKDIPISTNDYEKMGLLAIEWLKSEGHKNITKNTIDGIRLDFDDGWLLIRKSGTTPKIRVEGEHKEDYEKATFIIDSVAELLKKVIKIK